MKQEKKEKGKPVERKLFSPQKKVSAKKSNHEDDMMTNDFDSDLEASLDITCNVVSVLPREYNQVMEVEKPEDLTKMEMDRHKPICYYIMNNDRVEEQNAFFERPDESMKSH